MQGSLENKPHQKGGDRICPDVQISSDNLIDWNMFELFPSFVLYVVELSLN